MSARRYSRCLERISRRSTALVRISRRNQAGRKARRSVRSLPSLEHLSERITPAVTASFLPGAGVLSIFGDSLDNTITVKLDGTNYRITDPAGAVAGAGAVQVNSTTVDVPVASVTGIIDVRGNDGNDSLAIDLAGGNVSPSGGLLFTGGAGTDTVVGPNVAGTWSLTAAGGGTLTATGMTALTFASMEHLTGAQISAEIGHLTTSNHPRLVCLETLRGSRLSGSPGHSRY